MSGNIPANNDERGRGMTDDDGRVLKECHTKMALMKASHESVGKKIGELDNRVDQLVGSVDRLSVSVAEMKDIVLPAIANFPSIVEGEIRKHEESDTVHAAVKARAKRDITQKFLSSKPPRHPVDIDPVAKEKNKAINKIWTAVGGVAIAAGAWAVTHFFGG